MAADVSLMVVPSGANDGFPQILMESRGVWRETRPSVNSLSTVSAIDTSRELTRFLRTVMAQVGAGQFPNQSVMSNTFQTYYNDIVPADVQAALDNAVVAAAPGDVPLLRINLHPSTEWIPWELLHDGVNYLGLRFRIARLPIVKGGPDLSTNGPRTVSLIHSLLGEHVLDAQARLQWDGTFQGLHGNGVTECRFPASVAAIYPDLDTFNSARDADIIHLTCHGDLFDPKTGQGFWTLNHRSQIAFNFDITSMFLRNYKLDRRPLVFGNACASGAAAVGVNNIPTSGFGTTFFDRGAVNFVGTFAPVTKDAALDFAREFYTHLLGETPTTGHPIATALWKAKTGFTTWTDPSHLFYCLYGPPTTEFITA